MARSRKWAKTVFKTVALDHSATPPLLYTPWSQRPARTLTLTGQGRLAAPGLPLIAVVGVKTAHNRVVCILEQVVLDAQDNHRGAVS